MQVYTYSEARQKLAAVLDKAELAGSVIIRRRDGRSFTLIPQKTHTSPLDVPSVRGRISTADLVTLVRNERGRARGWKLRQ
jgi:antitoxin Phd